MVTALPSLRTLLGVALAALAGGTCANDVDGVTMENQPPPRKSLYLVVQVCRPDRTVTLEPVHIDMAGYPKASAQLWSLDVPSREFGHPKSDPELDAALAKAPQPDDVTIYRVARGTRQSDVPVDSTLYVDYILHQDDVWSQGANDTWMRGRTSTEQPVYELTRYRYQDMVALGVGIAADGRFAEGTYWYTAPPVNDVPTRVFSAWQAPLTREMPEQSSRILSLWPKQGRGSRLETAPPGAPRVRFRLISAVEYRVEQRSWDRVFFEWVRPKRVAGDHTSYMPEQQEPIPPC
jgi:hypothetical protein